MPMKRPSRILALSLSVVLLGILAILVAAPLAGQSKASSERLILSGDIVYFFGPGKPRNCTMSNRFKRGEPVGFRMTAINPATGKRDRATQLVLHLAYGGKTYKRTRFPKAALSPSMAQFSSPPPPAPPPTPIAPIISPSTTMGIPPELVKKPNCTN